MKIKSTLLMFPHLVHLRIIHMAMNPTGKSEKGVKVPWVSNKFLYQNYFSLIKASKGSRTCGPIHTRGKYAAKSP